MRPRPVVLFERLFLASLGLGVVASVLGWERVTEEAPVATVLAIQGVVIALMLGLILAVSRRGSRLAKWALVALWVVGSPLMLPALVEMYRVAPLVGGLQTAQVALQAAGLFCLFRPAAEAWFARAAP